MTDTAWDWDAEQEEPVSSSGLTRSDRLSAILVIVMAALAITSGLILRQRATARTWTYVSQEAGIEATYPAGWLVDEEDASYVARLRDPAARPFKTQYRIAIVPAGGQTSIRNVLDGLTFQRSTDLAAYRVLNVAPVEINGAEYTQMNFAFVEADPNPFVQRLPVVVLGRDIVIRDGDRVIVVTYMAEENRFDDDLDGFDRFFSSLRY
jgi:hypothetical protein